MLKISKSHWPNSKIYKKMLLVYFMLLFPVYILSFLINQIAGNYLRREITKSVMMNINFYSNQLDNEIAHIKYQQAQLMSDANVNQLGYIYNAMNNYERSKAISQLRERLGYIAYSSRYIDEISLYFRSAESMIWTGGVSYLQQEDIGNILELMKTNYVLYTDHEGRFLLMESYPDIQTRPISEREVINYIRINTKQVLQTLQNLVEGEGSGSLLWNPETGFLLATDEESPIIQEVLNCVQSVKDKHTVTEQIYYSEKRYWVIVNKMIFLNMWIVSYLPDDSVLGILKYFNGFFWALIIVSFVALIAFAIFASLAIHHPMSRLLKAFRTLEEGNLNVKVDLERRDEFGYLFLGFNSMVNRLRQSIEQNYEQRIALKQSELKQLQSQINPHFLYNCFYNINRMCKAYDMDNAMELSQRLGSYYYYITRNGQDMVPLHEEYKHAKDYAEIQSIRFSNRIIASMPELPEEYRELTVPRIIIQPVLENAYEHAFEHSINGGHIFVSTSEENNVFKIIVEDDGVLSEETLSKMQWNLRHIAKAPEKTGLINVCRRLQLKYNDKSGLAVMRSNYGGLRVEIVIYFE